MKEDTTGKKKRCTKIWYAILHVTIGSAHVPCRFVSGFTACSPVHSERTDFLCHLWFADSRRLMHLDCQYTVNYKFSNRHHELCEPDGKDPGTKKGSLSHIFLSPKITKKKKKFKQIFQQFNKPVKCTAKFYSVRVQLAVHRLHP